MDRELWTSEIQHHLFSSDATFVRTIVMRFYCGKKTLNDIWRELYPPEEYPNARTLDDVKVNSYKIILSIRHIYKVFSTNIYKNMLLLVYYKNYCVAV